MTNRELRRVDRRTVLKIIGTSTVAGASIGSASAANPLTRQLNSARSATRKYRDVEKARDDGYDHVSLYVPGMGFHFENDSFVADDEDEAGNIEKPAILVYFTSDEYNPDPFDPHDPNRDGDLRLGAVEYAHEGTPGADADYFDDEESERELKVDEEDGWEFVPPEGITGLHAWVHRGNPAGVFHPTNPEID